MIHIRSISLLAILFLLLAACKGDKKPQEETIDPSIFKNQDNTVYTRLPAEPDRLNMLLSTNVYARVVNEQLFLYLLHFDPKTLELTPQLAKSRPSIEEITEGPYQGGVAYTFEIHEEAAWDNGQPITGKDFEFTLKALFNPKVNAANIRAYLDYIRDIEIDAGNPRKFTVLTDKKYIIGETAVSNIPILPEYVYDPNGWMKNVPLNHLTDTAYVSQLTGPAVPNGQLAQESQAVQDFADAFNSPQYSREKGFIVGSGPYEFEEWVTGQRIVLNRKKGWWGDKLADRFPLLQAYPEKLSFLIIPDQSAAVTALKDQQIDVTGQIDAKDFVDLRENEMVNQLYNLHTPSSLVYYFVAMNNKKPRLADKRVRRALAHLVDVPALIEDLFYGLAERTVGPFHPAKSYYNKGLAPIEYNPEKARALLAEAGWEDTNGNGIVDKEINGELVEMELEYKVSSAGKFANSQALLFQNDAKKAGVKVNIVAKEFTVLIDDAKKRDYELYSGAWAQDPVIDDPKQLWHSESDTPDGGNRVSFSNAEADRLIEEIRVALDEDKRYQLYQEFQELIYEEQPYIFLFAPLERIAISKRFKAEPTARRPGYLVNSFIKWDAAPN
ncbi:MAG: hypothetical protein KDD19_25185 [Phaeodactylibacter sp.]|nr:hypothetical protein [Phaeodactylibacter sp.]MCB9051277.1 hypothetical protein [Lewinellaceae bacterium]